jgi:hypothetical protein
MQFLLLVYENQERLAHVPDAEKRRVSDACNTWFENLKKTGQGISLSRLHAVSTAATVRSTSGDAFVVTDGPFAETKELFAGYVLVECRDREEAIALTKTFPVVKITTVEVRPIMSLDQDAERWRRS